MTKVAILGFGTVGSGVAEVLSKNSQGIARRSGGEIQVKYILDVRDFPDSPFKDCFVKDFSIIENDPEVDVVVETIGGAKVALEFTTRALKAGKSVVSSNKELVATHGYELLQLAMANGVSYLFEASVGGGIPILRPLTNCLAANEVEQITGILNGTTNYILTRMIKAGLTFEQALKEAQDNGYAEKDPTASAVVADVIDIARDPKRDRGNQWGPGSEDLVVSSDSLTSRWYVRANLSMDQARLACGEILPLARSGAPAQEAAFLTQPMTYPQLMDRLAGVETCSVFRVL